jgi:hypothetical protein
MLGSAQLLVAGLEKGALEERAHDDSALHLPYRKIPLPICRETIRRGLTSQGHQFLRGIPVYSGAASSQQCIWYLSSGASVGSAKVV